MQQNVSLDVEESGFLPPSAWALLVIGLFPHALSMVGAEASAVLASYVCFPISMGPFACLHAYLLCTRMECSCRFACISVLMLSLLWFSILWWLWRKNAARTVAFAFVCSAISAAVIYWRIMPPA